MKTVTVSVTPTLIELVKQEIGLAENMSTEEIESVLSDFIEELSTEKQIILLLDNLDYFNQ